MSDDDRIDRIDRIEELARAILRGDAQLGDEGLYEIIEEHDGEQVVSDEAVLVEDHILALRAFDRALRIASGNA